MQNVAELKYLDRDAAVLTLQARGFPVTRGGLAKLDQRHRGPPRRLFGRKVLYREADLLSWAEGSLAMPAGKAA